MRPIAEIEVSRSRGHDVRWRSANRVVATAVIGVLVSLSAGADQFGNFTYEVTAGEVEITDFPVGVTGHVEIPDEIAGHPVTAIGTRAFQGGSFTSVLIPGSVTSLGTYAFLFCEQLDSVTLNEGLISIGNLAFAYCESLAAITLPASVSTVGSGPFRECGSLASINVVSGSAHFSSVGGVLLNSAQTTLVLCPEGKSEHSHQC